MSDLTVLIISTEPIIGALLTLYVGAFQHRAVLAESGERPDEAVVRSGASVIIVDLDHRDGSSPEFVARQRAAGRAVIAFSPKMVEPELRPRVGGLDVPWFAMPLETKQFRAVLEEATAATAAARPRE